MNNTDNKNKSFDKQIIILGIIAILAILYCVYQMINYGTDSNISNFKYLKPKEIYPSLFKIFGKPSHILNEENGVVIWENDKMGKHIFAYVVLRDEEILHCH